MFGEQKYNDRRALELEQTQDEAIRKALALSILTAKEEEEERKIINESRLMAKEEELKKKSMALAKREIEIKLREEEAKQLKTEVEDIEKAIALSLQVVQRGPVVQSAYASIPRAMPIKPISDKKACVSYEIADHIGAGVCILTQNSGHLCVALFQQLKKKGGHELGKKYMYAMPGGKKKTGESATQTARRECYEETSKLLSYNFKGMFTRSIIRHVKGIVTYTLYIPQDTLTRKDFHSNLQYLQASTDRVLKESFDLQFFPIDWIRGDLKKNKNAKLSDVQSSVKGEKHSIHSATLGYLKWLLESHSNIVLTQHMYRVFKTITNSDRTVTKVVG